ncbi:hypothetical protein FRAHR75_610041 [Frankia sp. Hr75.2]|nr:hypothetical protein FRAHR75_610041 [Frankia sp. Hr75.2]SQD97461.1 hypothetical protein FMEAI12_4110036 [Parafrankia sp. Ea1.12]
MSVQMPASPTGREHRDRDEAAARFTQGSGMCALRNAPVTARLRRHAPGNGGATYGRPTVGCTARGRRGATVSAVAAGHPPALNVCCPRVASGGAMWGGEHGLWESDKPVDPVNLTESAGISATIRKRLDPPAVRPDPPAVRRAVTRRAAALREAGAAGPRRPPWERWYWPRCWPWAPAAVPVTELAAARCG